MTEPVLQPDRGEKARAILAAPGLVTLAEAIALAVLAGAILPPTTREEAGD